MTNLNGGDPNTAPSPAPAVCVEYHNYAGGRPEINIVTPDGVGVCFPAEHLELVMKGLDLLKLLRKATEQGMTVFVTVDSEGRCDWEFGKERK